MVGLLKADQALHFSSSFLAKSGNGETPGTNFKGHGGFRYPPENYPAGTRPVSQTRKAARDFQGIVIYAIFQEIISKSSIFVKGYILG